MTGVVDDAAFLFVALRSPTTAEPELGVEFTLVVVVVACVPSIEGSELRL